VRGLGPRTASGPRPPASVSGRRKVVHLAIGSGSLPRPRGRARVGASLARRDAHEVGSYETCSGPARGPLTFILSPLRGARTTGFPGEGLGPARTPSFRSWSLVRSMDLGVRLEPPDSAGGLSETPPMRMARRDSSFGPRGVGCVFSKIPTPEARRPRPFPRPPGPPWRVHGPVTAPRALVCYPPRLFR
jgi:hypothetical protein